MDLGPGRLKELARAVAEGRLALAEIAAISPDELDAIYETAVMRLDVGRHSEAASMLAALVVLYPFAIEYWRAYAVALDQLGEKAPAQRARAMVRSLDPGTPEELVRELLGEHQVDEATNPHVVAPVESTAVADVRDVTPRLTPPRDATEPTEPRIVRTPAALDDVTSTQTLNRDITLTGVTAPATEPLEPTDRVHWPIEAEPTALTRKPGVPTTPRPQARERSVTALVDRRPRPIEGGDTARIDRRFKRRVTQSPLPVDDSLTAIVRRRQGLPLGEDA